jgi:triosephosphate isomerase
MRVPVIAGNWKMYKTADEAAAFVREFLLLVRDAGDVEIVLAPPFSSLAAVSALTRGTKVGVASQNVHFAEEGRGGGVHGGGLPPDGAGHGGRLRHRRAFGAAAIFRGDR